MAGSARTFDPNAHDLHEIVRALKMLRIQVPISSYDWTGAAPGPTDDITQGWKVGSKIITGTQSPPGPSNVVFICSKNDEGAAVWQHMMGTNSVESGGLSFPLIEGTDYVAVVDVSTGRTVRVTINDIVLTGGGGAMTSIARTFALMGS